MDKLVGRYIYYLSNMNVNDLSKKERYKLLKMRPHILKYIKNIVPTAKIDIDLKDKKYIIVNKKTLDKFKKQLNSI